METGFEDVMWSGGAFSVVHIGNDCANVRVVLGVDVIVGGGGFRRPRYIRVLIQGILGKSEKETFLGNA